MATTVQIFAGRYAGETATVTAGPTRERPGLLAVRLSDGRTALVHQANTRPVPEPSPTAQAAITLARHIGHVPPHPVTGGYRPLELASEDVIDISGCTADAGEALGFLAVYGGHVVRVTVEPARPEEAAMVLGGDPDDLDAGNPETASRQLTSWMNELRADSPLTPDDEARLAADIYRDMTR